jgi:hypothetical protein
MPALYYESSDSSTQRQRMTEVKPTVHEKAEAELAALRVVQTIAAAAWLIPSLDGPEAQPPDTTLTHDFVLDDLAEIRALHEPSYAKRSVRQHGDVNVDDPAIPSAPHTSADGDLSSGQRARLRRKIFHEMEAILREMDDDRTPGGLLRELRNTGAVGNRYTTAGNAANAAAAQRKRAKAVSLTLHLCGQSRSSRMILVLKVVQHRLTAYTTARMPVGVLAQLADACIRSVDTKRPTHAPLRSGHCVLLLLGQSIFVGEGKIRRHLFKLFTNLLHSSYYVHSRRRQEGRTRLG